MKLYTKGGDRGETSLVGNERVPKTDSRVEAYGSVDELTAFIGLLGDSMTERDADAALVGDLHRINSTLMGVEALLAAGDAGRERVKPLGGENIEWIEQRIDALQSQTAPITKFTIPGGCTTVSLCHVCRTVCRRAERAAVRASQSHNIEPSALVYLNRVSDYLYALGRILTEFFNVKEILWQP